MTWPGPRPPAVPDGRGTIIVPIRFASPRRSRDDVGDEFVAQHLDLVAEPELAFFEPGDLDLIGRSGGAQGIDGGVEVPVLRPQRLDPARDLIVVHATPPPDRYLPRRRRARPKRIDPQNASFDAFTKWEGALFADRWFNGFPSGEEKLPMHTAHQSALQAKHAGLDRRIADEEQRPLPDQTTLHDLKKQKLKLKEEIDAS
ncbi:MAG: YdcH family protein [Janthinobacterium lividum]